MAIGDRIKRARNFRGMTQKELGMAVGLDEKSADIRIAQYESGTRTPKEDLLKKIAEVLDVNYRSLYESHLHAAEDIMYALFELDEHYPRTSLYEVKDSSDPDSPEIHMALSFRNHLLDGFLKEWQLRKKQLAARAEYEKRTANGRVFLLKTGLLELLAQPPVKTLRTVAPRTSSATPSSDAKKEE